MALMTITTVVIVLKDNSQGKVGLYIASLLCNALHQTVIT
jgi:hypothetical protein